MRQRATTTLKAFVRRDRLGPRPSRRGLGRWPLVLLVAGLALGCTGGRTRSTGALPQADDPWFRSGEETLARMRSTDPIVGRAKNVILFIGDGMDVATVTAARIYDGQQRGEPGEENELSFERLSYRALLKTYNTNQQVADSAGAGTALLAGVKTKAGVIGLDDAVLRGDCAGAAGHEVASLFDLAREAGMSTGIVTTTRITHATPATAYGHTPERNWEADSDMPAAAIEQGCVDLARQLVEGETGSSLDVAFGGGRMYFQPETVDGPDGTPGVRADDRDLVQEWVAAHPRGRYVQTRQELQAADVDRVPQVLGLFAADHLTFEVDRGRRHAEDQPTLTEMTSRALDLLERDDHGYVLLVEGGRIDHAHHEDAARRALAATVEFSHAVQEAMDRTDPRETLIVVTSDHGHTMTISGYPTRGNPILGLVVGNDAAGRPETRPDLALDGKPYTTLSYANGPSAPRRGGRADLTGFDTTAPGFEQPSAVPLSMESHGGADVPSYARGPMAHLLTGTFEQNYVFHVLRYAAGLGTR